MPWMHLGKLMELRCSKCQMPLSNNKSSHTRKKKKSVSFGYYFSWSCAVKMEEGCLLGRQGRLWGNWGQMSSQHKKQTPLSLRVHRACHRACLYRDCSLLCSLTANESDLCWKWSLHVVPINLLLGGSSAYAVLYSWASLWICVLQLLKTCM